MQEQADAMELDELERAAEEYLGDVDLSRGVDLNEGLESIFDTGVQEFRGVVRKAARSGLLLLVVVLFCSMADGMTMGESKGVSVVALVGAIAVATVAVADIHSLIGMGKEAIGRMETLSKVLLPAMAVVTAAAGLRRGPPPGSLPPCSSPMCCLPSSTGSCCPWSMPMWRRAPPTPPWETRGSSGWPSLSNGW